MTVEMLTHASSGFWDMQAERHWHCDLRPGNVGVRPDAPAAQRYYVYDLGAATGPAATAAARSAGDECTLAAALASGRSPVHDLLYASKEALLGHPLGPCSDLQSALFTAADLSQHELPWAQAAAQGDTARVLELREAAARRPALLPCLAAWPEPLQQFAVAAMCSEPSAVQLAAAAIEQAATWGDA